MQCLMESMGSQLFNCAESVELIFITYHVKKNQNEEDIIKRGAVSL